MRYQPPASAAALAILLLASPLPRQGAPAPSSSSTSLSFFLPADKAVSNLTSPTAFPTPSISSSFGSPTVPGTSDTTSSVADLDEVLTHIATSGSTQTFGTNPSRNPVPSPKSLPDIFVTTSKTSNTARLETSTSFASELVHYPTSSSFPTSASTSSGFPSDLDTRPVNDNTTSGGSTHSIVPSHPFVPISISSVIPTRENSIKQPTYSRESVHASLVSITTNTHKTVTHISDITSSIIFLTKASDSNASLSAPIIASNPAVSTSGDTRSPTETILSIPHDLTRPFVSGVTRGSSRSPRSTVTKVPAEASRPEPQLLEVVVNAPRRRLSAIRSCSVGYTWIRGLCRRIFSVGSTTNPS